MNHIPEERIQAYITDTLTEDERTQLEGHLFECDDCLGHYMKWVELSTDNFPELPANDDIVDLVMGRLPNNSPAQQSRKPSKVTRLRPLVHYMIAASITLMLMASGVFQGMTGLASTIDEAPKHSKTSVSQNIMERTIQWLDFKQLSSKEGEQ